MSSWKIAAAQYAPLNASPAEHVAIIWNILSLRLVNSANCWSFRHCRYQAATKEINRCPPRLTRRFYSRSLMRPILTI